MKSKSITYIAIFTAIAIALENIFSSISNFLPFYPNGGSITLTLVPLFYLSYRYGFIGLFSGLLVGLIQEFYFVHFIQYCFDYLVPFMVLGVSGVLLHYFKKENNNFNYFLISISIFIVFILRMSSLYISGTYWGVTGLTNILYNLSYVLPSAVLSLIVIILTFSRLSKYIDLNTNIKQISNEQEKND